MGEKQLLFVTYNESDFDEGLSYAIDLAKTMDERMAILLVHGKKIRRKFEKLVTAVAFAEANEHEKAAEFMRESKGNSDDGEYNAIPDILVKECHKSGISAKVYTTMRDTVSAITDFLNSKTGIDMVLLNPNVTNNGHLSSKELNRLVKTTPNSIVTIAKRACTA
jgi:hypothetical protein